MIVSNLIKEQKDLSINNILLDLQNPRYNDKLVQTGKKNWNEEAIQEIIKDDLIN